MHDEGLAGHGLRVGHAVHCAEGGFAGDGPDVDVVVEEAWAEIFSSEVDGCFVGRGNYVVFVLGRGDGFYGSVGDFYGAVGEDGACGGVYYVGIFENVCFLRGLFPGLDEVFRNHFGVLKVCERLVFVR